MLSPDQLDGLAHDLESHRVDRMASFKAVKSDVEEAICAFSNDLAGSRMDYVRTCAADIRVLARAFLGKIDAPAPA